MFAHRARQLGKIDAEVDRFVIEALFATVTNVDFDPARLQTHLNDAARIRDRARQLYEDACRENGSAPASFNGPTTWQPAADIPGLVGQGRLVSIAARKERLSEDIVGLQELGDGTARRGQHRHLRHPSRPGPHHAGQGQVHLVSGHDLKDLALNCSSRPRARASTSTRTARCCPATPIRN
jgi:hypothetical protein